MKGHKEDAKNKNKKTFLLTISRRPSIGLLGYFSTDML
jgi:hypothetical protein